MLPAEDKGCIASAGLIKVGGFQDYLLSCSLYSYLLIILKNRKSLLPVIFYQKIKKDDNSYFSHNIIDSFRRYQNLIL